MNNISLDDLIQKRDRQINGLDFTLSLREVVWDTQMGISELYGRNTNRGMTNALPTFAQKDLTTAQIESIQARLLTASTYEELMQELTDNNADHLIYPVES